MVEYKMNYGPAIGEHSAKKKISPDGKKIVKNQKWKIFQNCIFWGKNFKISIFWEKIANYGVKIRSGKFFKIAFFGENFQDKQWKKLQI